MSKGQSSSTNQPASLDPRTQRAVGERMNIVPHGDGVYRVRSQSGNAYIVDLPATETKPNERTTATCTCRDYERSKQGDHCKHIRRVKLDIAFGQLPRPEKPAGEIDNSSRALGPPGPGTHSGPASVVTDGGGAKAASEQGTSDGPAPESPPSPDLPNESRKEAYRRIADRIDEIETEVAHHQAELDELEQALSAFGEPKTE